jgi:hypothetical protein
MSIAVMSYSAMFYDAAGRTATLNVVSSCGNQLRKQQIERPSPFGLLPKMWCGELGLASELKGNLTPFAPKSVSKQEITLHQAQG